MDYPARVATKLKIASHWRVAKRVVEAKVCESLASRWQDPGSETIQGSLAAPGETPGS